METIWMLGDYRNGYHDYTCRCTGHCGHCFEDLALIRATRARMIAEGTIPASDQLHPRAGYCSPYCKGRAKRDRAFTRLLSKGALT